MHQGSTITQCQDSQAVDNMERKTEYIMRNKGVSPVRPLHIMSVIHFCVHGILYTVPVTSNECFEDAFLSSVAYS